MSSRVARGLVPAAVGLVQGHITALPREVLATPFGQMLAPMLSQTIGDRLGHVHQSDAQQGPASGPQAANEVSHIAADIKNVAAVAAADTGIPVEAGPHGAEVAQAAAAVCGPDCIRTLQIEDWRVQRVLSYSIERGAAGVWRSLYVGHVQHVMWYDCGCKERRGGERQGERAGRWRALFPAYACRPVRCIGAAAALCMQASAKRHLFDI